MPRIVALLLTLVTGVSIASAQSASWRLIQADDGTLYVITGAVRHRVVPAKLAASEVAFFQDADPWLEGYLGGTEGSGEQPAVTSQGQPQLGAPQPTAEGPLRLIAQGYGQRRTELGVAFIVENTYRNEALEGSRYQIAAYNGTGEVLKTESGYLQWLQPGQRLGIAETMYLPEGTTPARVDIQLSAGKIVKEASGKTFTSENARFVADRYLPKATGIVRNPYDRDVSHVRVSAVLYDRSGSIMGGGFAFLDFIPAGGQAAAEMSVVSAETPSRVELYATLSGLSDLPRPW